MTLSHTPLDQNLDRRIALIAPIAPFRSGIAKHSTMLARALVAAGAAVRIFSFDRQYPKLLFPGESDRDPGGLPPHDVDARYELDSLDPRTWRRTVADIAAFAPDMVIIPTWTFFMAPCLAAVARGCRARGLHVRLFCHNVFDHEASFWKRWLVGFLLRTADSFVTHSDEMAAEIRAVRPDAPVAVHPHPIYDQYPLSAHSLPREADLELLFFGLIRSYKGLDVAIRAMAQLKDLSVRLRVVGEFWEGREAAEAAIGEAGLGERVLLTPRYVSDAEAADFFARADAVVLPYLSATGSGVVPLAYHYGKPVAVTDLPGLTAVVRDGQTGWIVPPGDAEALAAVVRERISSADFPAMAAHIEMLKKDLSWDGLAKVVAAR